MASHTLTVSPGDVVTTVDIEGTGGPIAGLFIDGTTLFLGNWGPGEDGNASIVASAELLIGKLGELRHAAAKRIAAADLAAIDDASPAQEHVVVAEWMRA